MRGLTIVIATDDELRLRSAFGLALSHAALGGAVRLFLDTAAVALLARGKGAHDAAHVAAGLPALGDLWEEAFAAGVEVTACQAGLALARLRADALDPRLGFGGMVGLLGDIGDDRLVVV
jgi:predicted peroxiredoxin